MKKIFKACCVLGLFWVACNTKAEVTECAPGVPLGNAQCATPAPDAPAFCSNDQSGVRAPTPILGANIIGTDAAYIQCLIVDAIKNTSADKTARVTLPGYNPYRYVIVNGKKVYNNDWYFTNRGLGIAIPRSNFVFDGAGAIFHVRTDGGGYNGNIVGIQGLDADYDMFYSPDVSPRVNGQLQPITFSSDPGNPGAPLIRLHHTGAKFIGFDYTGRVSNTPVTYTFPKGGSAVTVEFEPIGHGNDPVVRVSRINGMLLNQLKYDGGPLMDQTRELIVENVQVSNIKIVHEYNRPVLIESGQDYNNQDTNTQYAVNSVGIVFANNVTIDSVIVKNSPQTAFGIVAEPNYSATNITLSNCSSIDSGNEAIRYIFNRDTSGVVDRAEAARAKVFVSGTIDSSTVISSGRVSQAGDSNVDPTKRRTHVFYRAKTSPCSDADLLNKATGCNALSILNSNFDSSAEIDSSLGAPRLTIKSSSIAGGVALLGDVQNPDLSDSKVSIIGNNFQCYYAKPPYVESCVHIQNVVGVKLNSNQISGDRVSWFDSNKAVTTQTNYSLDGSGNMAWR